MTRQIFWVQQWNFGKFKKYLKCFYFKEKTLDAGFYFKENGCKNFYLGPNSPHQLISGLLFFLCFPNSKNSTAISVHPTLKNEEKTLLHMDHPLNPKWICWKGSRWIQPFKTDLYTYYSKKLHSLNSLICIIFCVSLIQFYFWMM